MILNSIDKILFINASIMELRLIKFSTYCDLAKGSVKKLLDDYVTLSLSVDAYVAQEQIKDGIVIGMLLNDQQKERKDKIVNSLF